LTQTPAFGHCGLIASAPPSVTGGGILVWVGVLRVTGMEPDQGEANGKID
jgi:hypothetical protein